MKAIRVSRFGGSEVLELQEIADPPAPGPGQVRVRLHAAGVNPVEAYIRNGKYPRLPQLPYTPGSDGAGVVEAVGPDVRGFDTGGRVYLSGSITGTYAEKALCTVDQLHHLSGALSFEQGAAIGVPYGTACRALFGRGGAQAGETMLVHGASGGVGTAAVQLATAAGLCVFGTAGSAQGLDHVRRSGAVAAFDHREPNYLDEIRNAAGKTGIDLILEMLANQNLGKDLTLIGLHGRVVVVGSRGPVEIDPRDTMMRDADIRGMTLMNVTREEAVDLYARIDGEMAAGKALPVIGHVFPLAEAASAHEKIMEPGAAGKIVLVM